MSFTNLPNADTTPMEDETLAMESAAAAPSAFSPHIRGDSSRPNNSNLNSGTHGSAPFTRSINNNLVDGRNKFSKDSNTLNNGNGKEVIGKEVIKPVNKEVLQRKPDSPKMGNSLRHGNVSSDNGQTGTVRRAVSQLNLNPTINDNSLSSSSSSSSISSSSSSSSSSSLSSSSIVQTIKVKEENKEEVPPSKPKKRLRLKYDDFSNALISEAQTAAIDLTYEDKREFKVKDAELKHQIYDSNGIKAAANNQAYTNLSAIRTFIDFIEQIRGTAKDCLLFGEYDDDPNEQERLRATKTKTRLQSAIDDGDDIIDELYDISIKALTELEESYRKIRFNMDYIEAQNSQKLDDIDEKKTKAEQKKEALDRKEKRKEKKAAKRKNRSLLF